MNLPTDTLESTLARDAQEQAARLVQDAFSEVFRQTLEGEPQARVAAVLKVAAQLNEWVAMADAEGRPARMALLLTGLDQWGLAWSQAFGPAGLLGITALVGALRDTLDVADEGRCQTWFARLNDDEGCGFAFKVDLRRGIHLALWHTMIAAAERDEALAVLRTLGGLMVGLTRQMPQSGWRLVADALAHIQLRCLAHGLAIEGLAQETTQELFAALSRELPKDERDRIMAHATQAVIAWQRSGRTTN
ncbi:hypothetical protein GCM10025771_15780 [Niveibacterium umoris]|uniref:Uncharacterized protein n=1 Tax=Niveibacterium umoris TaxID=1193620 RepID=A0A840BSA4_9RHOO|nr:hypothetical protein [Niveibacterium umoris]MBB4014552.1 hypothetical protein [Niveibacterium umoris]